MESHSLRRADVKAIPVEGSAERYKLALLHSRSRQSSENELLSSDTLGVSMFC